MTTPSHTARRLLAAAALTIGVCAGTGSAAQAATTAVFASGTLTVTGDAAANSIVISRDAAGTILVNGGTVSVSGGTATVANTAQVRVLGLDGADAIALSEVNGALPKALLFGGSGNDVLTGGSGADQLFGQAGNDTLLGKGGGDMLFGGTENDTITGGDADDQAFGQGGSDRMIWNPGDDTDLNEGGEGTDTVEVNGGNGTEVFSATANGTRVRFDRITPAPFSLDIGTSEKLALNANGGDDRFSATGNLAALIALTVDGGPGADTLLGGNGADTLLGGDNDDFVDGNQGNDTVLLGAGTDTFQWDPGDGSDTIEGQDGSDTIAFNGANIDEIIGIAPNGPRVRLTRNIAAITLDFAGIEKVVVKALGGIDNLSVGDLSGTGLANVVTDLAVNGAPDGLADTVNVSGTNGDDAVDVTADASSAQVAGLPAVVNVTGATPGSDRVVVDALGGADVVDASTVPAGSPLLTLDGGAGDDVLVGGAGDDVLLGGEGDDVLLGGPGNDTIDGGPGDNVAIQGDGVTPVAAATVVGAGWLRAHASRTARGATVIDVGARKLQLPRADLAQLLRGA